MNSYYCLFRKLDGSILSVLSGTEGQVKLSLEVGLGLAPCDETVSDITHWVDLSDHKRVVREKTPLNTEHTVNGLRVAFHHLPPETTADVEELSLITDAGDTVIEFDIPGTYQIQFRPPPQYLDTELEVTVG